MTAAWRTADDQLRHGATPEDVRCEMCGGEWDGEGALSARPLCAAHRAEVVLILEPAIAVVRHHLDTLRPADRRAA